MSPEQLEALSRQVPDLAVAALLTVFLTDAILAWVPRRLGSWTLPALEGGRVIAIVFLAALVVVALVTDRFAFSREFVLAAIAVTFAAVSGNTIHDKLNDQREASSRAALSASLLQPPPK